jgi:hypothetical protein
MHTLYKLSTLTDRKHVDCTEGFSLGELDNKLVALGDK